jgi:hypothetical protein
VKRRKIVKQELIFDLSTQKLENKALGKAFFTFAPWHPCAFALNLLCEIQLIRDASNDVSLLHP